MKIQVKIKAPPSFRQGGRVRWVRKSGSKFAMDSTYTTLKTAEDLVESDYQKLKADEEAGFIEIVQAVE